MRIILDTNVFISGIFFSGPPYTILEAWRDGSIQLVISPEIFKEYQRVAEELSIKYTGIDISDVLDLLLVKAEMIDAGTLPESVSADADDDKFIACAVAGSLQIIVSGDRHLLDISTYRNVPVLKPRRFVDEYLSG
jgi:uncharacterized protein